MQTRYEYFCDGWGAVLSIGASQRLDQMPSGFNGGGHSTQEIECLKFRIKQLEQELAEAKKDQARYQYVKAMTYDKFGEMSHDPVRFDEQVDAAIEETK